MFRIPLSLSACAVVLAAALPAAASEGLTVANANREIPFQWSPAQFGDRTEPHAAILIPVQVQGCAKTLFMQFDLGASRTVLLQDKAASLAQNAPSLVPGADGTIETFDFTMGDVTAAAHDVRLVNVDSQSAIACDNPSQLDIIGTIGADLLANRVLVIDYPRSRIFVGDAAPAQFAASSSQPMIQTPRGVILTGVEIDGERKNIMLDTGSSAFALLTDQADWARKTGGGAGETRFSVNSWGRTLTAHTAPANSIARFGETEIPIREVSYMEGVSEAQTQAMRASGMGGMTGNKLFVDKVLVLDAVHRTYSVRP